MHPKNPYAAAAPDFSALANALPSLKPFLVERAQEATRLSIDFQNPEAIRQLTMALLERDFGLHLSLPTDRLCPTVPGRLDYCLWIIDLLNLEASESTPGDEYLGVDIGTGSSAIYPLLLSRLLPRMKILATEIDQKSYDFALVNISTNALSDRIELIRYTPEQLSIFPVEHILQSPARHSFTMCNPPFYSSKDEIDELSLKKETVPHAACTGSETEMLTPGGEEAFINQLIKDSLALKSHIRWFTSLCGKFTTLADVVKTFKIMKGNNYALTELLQGQTRRWVIGWSWQDWRLPDAISRPSGVTSLRSTKNLLPLPNEMDYHLPTSLTAILSTDELSARISRILTSLPDLQWRQSQGSEGRTDRTVPQGSAEAVSWNVTALRKSWSRAERRKRKLSTHQPSNDGQTTQQGGSIIKLDGTNQTDLNFRPILEASLTLFTTKPSRISFVAKSTSNQCIELGDPSSKEMGLSSKEGPALAQVGDGVYTLHVRWIRGYERDVFESFWNHMIKKVIHAD
ncbi:hypothetical protein CROQUDRAFT_84160 [Cronartium quercuum f. sp. fusiforme G11]|uniref:U6 small nuclear RNA (adenine-(43)-N(6))-methyltransferase n=1 Tax=Cronartium quercuum f. sp. fusiforme G11 TaxID=708437 RepID=A0A9P6NA68_9BASI|nr:hypothetical protein CROQUDRAFT_84160 [Cronartium quercuum f. sp. fusiforme G11]